MNLTAKIFLAGHGGMVGSAIHKKLLDKGFTNIITRTREELDLSRQEKVELFFQKEKIDTVIVAAARVGGILANSKYGAEFLYENIILESNIIHSCINQP